ncbi:MAG: hypothetical protein V1794_10205 [Candidatus Glassbacteria bacterium]
MGRRNRRKGSGAGGRTQGAKPAEQARKVKPSPASDGEGENQRGSKANMVVLLDADADYVEMESKAVVNYISGYNPMGFTQADRALNYVTNPRNEGRIGLVLLDLDLGDGGTGSVEQVIRVVTGLGTVPIAAVSRRNDKEIVERVLSFGGVGFLPKAFTLEVFVRFVKNILRHGKTIAWQCESCGKLVAIDQLDLLKMKPIKCTDRACESVALKELGFVHRRKKSGSG